MYFIITILECYVVYQYVVSICKQCDGTLYTCILLGISTEDPFDQTILRVTAKDRDSTDVVYYSIKPDDNSVDASNMFAVHPQSGILSNRILMGNNPEQTFSIRLTASDLTNEDKATALVNMSRCKMLF